MNLKRSNTFLVSKSLARPIDYTESFPYNRPKRDVTRKSLHHLSVLKNILKNFSKSKGVTAKQVKISNPFCIRELKKYKLFLFQHVHKLNLMNLFGRENGGSV